MSAFTNIARRYIAPVAGARSDRLRLGFDIEANGLLHTATTVHCIVIIDLDSGQVYEYGPDQIGAALEHLARADELVGHNAQSYDLPLLERLHGWRPKPDCVIIDTLVAGRLILPNINDLDDQAAAMGDPPLGKLRGRYSLEAWGMRLGIPKTGTDIEDWSTWTPEMQARCVRDVAICKTLWHFLQVDGCSREAMALEHRVALVCEKITQGGVPFDRAAAEQLREQWESKRAELKAKLQEQFPGTNINSRPQLGALLEARGWIPEKRTEKTEQPSITDEVLETIPALFPEFTGLAEYELLRRRLAQLATGQQAWLKHVGDDGRIHGALIHIGTPHSRAKHLAPNIAQVPNAKKGGAYAAECRALFRHSGDWVFVTCDQSNLQDRAFAHHLAEFDGGAYAQDFLAGVDKHWQNAAALELIPAGTARDKESKVHTAIREGAKTFRYGNLFGAGAARCTEILTETVRAVQHIDPTYTAPTDGKRARARFIAATPGLAPLQTKLETQVARSQWLPGLDGRRVPTRAQYTALNYALASIEAIVCKRWLLNVYDELCARFKYGWDGDVVITLWVHDEIAVCCRPEIAEQVGEILTRHAKEVGRHYQLKVPLDAEFKIGRSWAGEPVTPIAEPIAVEMVLASTGGETEIMPAVVADLESDVAAAGDDDGLEDSANADDGDRQLGHVGGIDAARAGGHHDHGAAELADATTTTAAVGLVESATIDFAPAASARAEEVADSNGSDPRLSWVTPTLGEIPYTPELRALCAAEMAKVEDGQQAKPNGGGAAGGERTAGDVDQDAGGERFNGHNGDYGDRSSEQHAGKPYGPARIRLITQGYRVARTFPFLVPGETEPRFFEDRWVLKPEITPTKERPRKTCRYWHRANGQELNDTGPRRIIYNWPAIMAAGPGANVFVTEGANKSKPLNEKGLLATAAPYHQWGPECTAALAGYHLFYLADHCNPLLGWNAHDNDPAARYAEDAKKKLASRAASFRIVPALQLWKKLGRAGEPPYGWDVKDWLELGGDSAKLLEICREIPAEGSKNDDPLFWHGEPDPRPRRKWRIKQLMPGVGAGLLSGQWGTYKTFMAIELATTVIAAETQFCGRRLVEPCGVLILATEGAFELRDRIDAAVHNKYPDKAQAPITWRESCPTLLADGAAEQLIKIVQEAAEGCKARFGLPLGLVIIDVLTDAAGYAKAGDENDPAIGAKLMGVFRRAAEACGCFVLAVDHFGKSVEAGTRGTSAKEGSADTILACLGEREVSGTVTNTRLALRKVRGGPQGQEFPYKPRVVPVLEPCDEGGSETTCVIDWEAAAPASSDPWEIAARQIDTKLAMRALRRAMMKLLAEYGVEKVSEPGAAAVRMVSQDMVREEFYANTVADGDLKQKQNAKRQRFHRALARAEDQKLIGRRDIEGTTYLWFINL